MCSPRIEELRKTVEESGGDVKLSASRLVCGIANLVRNVKDADCAGKLAEELDSASECLSEAVACNK